MPDVFTTTRFVEFSDTDMAGIAHFSSFFRYMEAAEHALLRSLGLSVHATLREGEVVSFPRVNAQCDYHAPARCEDDLDIAVTVKRLGKSSVTYGFRFTRDDTPIATGQMTSVCCRFLPGKPPEPTPIPEEIVSKLRAFVAD